MYRMSTEVKTLSEHINSYNIIRYVIYISIYCVFLYLFASTLLLCIIYSNFFVVDIVVLQYFRLMY